MLSTNPTVLVRVPGESERGIASSDGGSMVTESGGCSWALRKRGEAIPVCPLTPEVAIEVLVGADSLQVNESHTVVPSVTQ